MDKKKQINPLRFSQLIKKVYMRTRSIPSVISYIMNFLINKYEMPIHTAQLFIKKHKKTIKIICELTEKKLKQNNIPKPTPKPNSGDAWKEPEISFVSSNKLYEEDTQEVNINSNKIDKKVNFFLKLISKDLWQDSGEVVIEKIQDILTNIKQDPDLSHKEKNVVIHQFLKKAYKQRNSAFDFAVKRAFSYFFDKMTKGKDQSKDKIMDQAYKYSKKILPYLNRKYSDLNKENISNKVINYLGQLKKRLFGIEKKENKTK